MMNNLDSSSAVAKLLISELKALSKPEKAEKMKRYFKTGKGEYAEGDIFWGVAVPDQRKIAKKYRDISLDELSILISHPVHEVRHMGLCTLVYKSERATLQERDDYAQFYLAHLSHVNNWDLVDASCRFILGAYLEDKDRSLLYEFAASDSVWERRIAIITGLHFIKQRDFDDALLISDILLTDAHDLIQKAVGWVLREIGNLDYDAEFAFLVENDRYKKMPRTMLRYAIEKFEQPIRKQFLSGTA
jgi:3-methyladenine DNA glycosylase AlkD